MNTYTVCKITCLSNNIEYGSLTLAAKAFNISRETLKKRYL